MEPDIEAQEVLEAVVAGIPEMADFISAVPEGQKAAALDAAERHHLVTARNVGCADDPARLWVAAVMLQIRHEMERIAEGSTVVGNGPAGEFSLAERGLTRATGALALLAVSPLIAFVWVGLKLERPGSAIALRRVKPGRTKAYSYVLGPGRISQFVRRGGLQTLPSLWNLLNGDNILRFHDFVEILQLWKTSPFPPLNEATELCRTEKAPHIAEPGFIVDSFKKKSGPRV